MADRRKLRLFRASPGVVLGIFALVLALGGIGYAAIPSSTDGKISSCYHNTKKTIRLIDAEAGEQCKPSETQLDWNQTGPAGPAGPQGPPGPAGPKFFASPGRVNLPATSPEFRIVTPTFVVPAGVSSCLVTSTVQLQPSGATLADSLIFRNAITQNGVNGEDGQYGHYAYNDGTGRKQAPMSRSSVFSVSPGQTVGFGVYLNYVSSVWAGTPYAPTTSYLCS